MASYIVNWVTPDGVLEAFGPFPSNIEAERFCARKMAPFTPDPLGWREVSSSEGDGRAEAFIVPVRPLNAYPDHFTDEETAGRSPDEILLDLKDEAAA